jgi:predicted nucleic acid-binding protein
MVLVDTDVLIECLRGSPVAKNWLTTLIDETVGIPGVVAMELLMGCRNQSELQQVQRFLSAFTPVWPEAPEFERGYCLLLAHRLSSGLSIPDALVAAMALVRGFRLYTFNVRHFQIITGLDVQQPYQRP